MRVLAVVLSMCATATALADAAAVEHMDDTAEDAQSPYHWDRGRPRLVVSTRLDVGAIARAQLHVGYGKPFWNWVGAEVHALTTTEFGALYVGVRASSPVLEVSAGMRFDATYRRGRLPMRDRYTDDDLEASNAPSRYRALDLDLYGVLPVGRLLMPIEVAATYLPRGGPRYEEFFRVVVTGSWVVAVRAAPLVVLDTRRRHRLGVLFEWLRDVGRAASTFRLGPAYQFAITPLVDVYLVGTLAPASPDGLSAWNDLYGTASIRYRWASGDPSPPRIRDLRRTQ